MLTQNLVAGANSFPLLAAFSFIRAGELMNSDGIKLRVMQNKVFLDRFKTLAANAVPMSFQAL